ncbi:MAG: Lrp/AsnC family transcriptional regulator [Promethearchaeota archaeon]
MISEQHIEDLKLDEIDVKIISMIEAEPSLTHSEIARRINRSQPAVGSRIHKLQARGILEMQAGVDFKKFSMYLVKVEFSTKKPDEIVEMAQNCPFVINAMKLTGDRNMCVLLAATELRKLDAVVDYHFRDHADIDRVKMEMVTDFANSFVLPVNFETEYHDPDPKRGCGEQCWRYLKKLEENAEH